MRCEVFCCSTLLSVATALAAAEQGDVGVPVRRVLLAADYSPEPEVGTPLLERSGGASLARRFEQVVDVNELIAPHHPGGWSPGRAAARLLGRLLGERWQLGDDVHLYVEPIQLNFAAWVLELFPDASVTVVSDGLMAYGPSRRHVPAPVARRVASLAFLDLVPGLRPVYLSEYNVPTRPVAAQAVRAFFDGLDAVGLPEGLGDQGPVALVLGQYLAALGVLSEAEEQELHARAVLAAVSRGHDRVVFTPHPAAAPSLARGLQRTLQASGVAVGLVEATGAAEQLFSDERVTLVVGCFSTGLFTASRLYGLPVVSVGTELLLERLTPYENSNRVPVTLADYLLPGADPDQAPPSGQDVSAAALVRAVSYCMQSERYPHLRHEAERTFASAPRLRDRYVKRKRLRALGMALEPRPVTKRRLALRARARLLRIRHELVMATARR